MDAPVLLARLIAMQTALVATHHVQGQLKRRPETRDGLQTWMEVYPAAPSQFEAALDAAVEQAGVTGLTAGPRHVEVFTDLNTCA